MRFVQCLLFSALVAGPLASTARVAHDESLLLRAEPHLEARQQRNRFGGGRFTGGVRAKGATTASAAATSAAGQGQGGNKGNQAAATTTAAAGANQGGNKGNQGGNKGNQAAATSSAAAAASSAATGNKGQGQGGNNNNNNAGGNKGNQAANNGGGASLTLNPSVIQVQAPNANATAGQAASAVSNNNFIDFCVGQTLTNGTQIAGGSCNPVPMGKIPASNKTPSVRITNPKNGDKIAANKDLTISVISANIQLGDFTNAQKNYYSAPQDLNAQGQIIGHTHVVVQSIPSANDASILDTQTFDFFKGINAPPKNGVSTADVPGGLKAGTYRLCTITSAANHQGTVAAVAQRGATDDCVIFTAA